MQGGTFHNLFTFSDQPPPADKSHWRAGHGKWEADVFEGWGGSGGEDGSPCALTSHSSFHWGSGTARRRNPWLAQQVEAAPPSRYPRRTSVRRSVLVSFSQYPRLLFAGTATGLNGLLWGKQTNSLRMPGFNFNTARAAVPREVDRQMFEGVMKSIKCSSMCARG